SEAVTPVSVAKTSSIEIQCSENPLDCLCGDGWDHAKPNPLVKKGYKAEDVFLVMLQPDTTVSQTTNEFLTITQRQPWKPRSMDPKQPPTKYDICLPIPRGIPPSAMPTKGAIDYRIEAKFLLPHDEGFDEIVAQKRVEIVRTHVCFGGNFSGPSVPRPVARPELPTVFQVAIDAPGFAYLDNGKIHVGCKLTCGDSESLKLIRTVVLSVEERRKYVVLRKNNAGQTVRSITVDTDNLGEKVVTELVEIRTGKFERDVKFGNGVAGAGNSGVIPILVHPTFSGGQLFVSHHVVVRVLYGDKPAGMPSDGKVGHAMEGMTKLFKKLTHEIAIPGNKEEEFSTPIVLRTGGI
ncbi:hypothetical protein HDU98_007078, partial [Podochytrium sp. JEL0797]